MNFGDWPIADTKKFGTFIFKILAKHIDRRNILAMCYFIYYSHILHK